MGSTIQLRLYQKLLGGKDRLVTETATDAKGLFSFKLAATDAVNAEVHAVRGAGAEVALSTIRFNLGSTEQMNLVAPLVVRPLGSEYQRLMADLVARASTRPDRYPRDRVSMAANRAIGTREARIRS
jgi:hypothetical protein